jgi:hypothetical protein
VGKSHNQVPSLFEKEYFDSKDNLSPYDHHLKSTILQTSSRICSGHYPIWKLSDTVGCFFNTYLYIYIYIYIYIFFDKFNTYLYIN